MAKVLYPKTQIMVVETNTLYNAYQTAEPGVFTSQITFPANTDAADKTYTLKVYANDVATDITTTVTVVGTATDVVRYAVDSIMTTPEALGSEGGSVAIGITFKVEAPAA